MVAIAGRSIALAEQTELSSGRIKIRLFRALRERAFASGTALPDSFTRVRPGKYDGRSLKELSSYA